MTRILSASGLLLLLISFTGSAYADEIFSFKAGYLTLSPEGRFAGTDEGIGTELDLDHDVGLDDSEELYAEAALQISRFRLAASYSPLNFSGTSTLDRTIFFNGQTFNVSETIKGDIDVDLYDLGLTFYVINMDDLPVRLQLGVEVAAKAFDGELRLTSRTTGLSEEVSGTAVIPSFGGRARLAISDLLGVVGRVGYAEYEGNSYLDADGQVEFSPVPLFGIFAGYRYLDLDIDESGILLDARFEGPYGGAFVRF